MTTTAQTPAADTPPPHRGRRRLVALVAGVAVAAVLAAVLSGGFGSSGSSPAAATGAVVAPGIDQATANVLSLDVLGRRNSFPAKAFTVTDQHGNPVSLAQFRGKVVVLTFNDDECTDLCTLLAQDLLVAQRDLGSAAKNVVWLGVNVNPYHPQVSAVKAWTDEHRLDTLPNWYFGTASVPALQQIWHEYGVYVQTDAATRTVGHGTEMFFIGPTGVIQAIGDFGSSSADTTYFAHAVAQMAVDLLPASQRTPVGGPVTPPATVGHVSPDAPAPGFSLPALDPTATAGNPVTLAAFRGEPTVINFWSSTCVPCKAELPQLQAAARQLAGKVHFVGIDVADQPAAARAVAAQAGITYPLASDRGGQVAAEYGVSGTPYTVLVGPKGTIRVLHPGTFTTEQVTYELQALFPQLAPSVTP